MTNDWRFSSLDGLAFLGFNRLSFEGVWIKVWGCGHLFSIDIEVTRTKWKIEIFITCLQTYSYFYLQFIWFKIVDDLGAVYDGLGVNDGVSFDGNQIRWRSTSDSFVRRDDFGIPRRYQYRNGRLWHRIKMPRCGSASNINATWIRSPEHRGAAQCKRKRVRLRWKM